MAKKGGSGNTYTSKGERRSSMKTGTPNAGDRLLNQQRAWLSGKNVSVTIENPNNLLAQIQIKFEDAYADT